MPHSKSSAIYTGLARAARAYPQRRAVTYLDRQWTYSHLEGVVRSAAQKLADHRIKSGDRVAFFARNSDSYLIGWLATQALGAVHVPINFMLGQEEVRYILQHSGALTLFVGQDFRAVAEEAASGLEISIVEIDDLQAAGPQYEVEYSRDEASQHAQLAYTSGTESRPKGALLSDIGLVHQYLSCITVGDYQPNDIVLNALPLFHCAQMHCFLTPYIFLAAENIIVDRPEPGELIRIIEDAAVTSFFAPPTVWIGILNHPEFDPSRLKSLTKGYYGASIMPVEVLMRIRKALPWLKLWNYYGQTEIGPLAAALRPDEIDARPASVGRPVMFVETRLVDDEMNDVPRGEIGEIVHRSPQLMKEYYNDPDKTAEAFQGGWFHSGDLGVMDDEGFYQIVDRKKDMIKSGGENVSSREVEEVIYTHPAVAEVAVVGVPDAKWIEAVTAVVVLKSDAEVSGEEIIDWTAKRLAPFKRPKKVRIVPSLPKNPSGKILKKDLRQFPAQ